MMNPFLNFLTDEQKLLILTSRLTLSNEDITCIQELISKETINWFEFFKLALYHKTATLCHKNIKNICARPSIPKYLDDFISMAAKGIAEKNEKYQAEVKRITAAVKENGACVIPTKGSILVPQMYEDYGIRYSGDMDFLIEHSDIDKVNSALTELGYIQGTFEHRGKIITPAKRASLVKWKIYMSNLYPYVRYDDIFYKVDIRYSFDDTLHKEAMYEIVASYKTCEVLAPEFLLLHMCTHFYDEAKHITTIQKSKDLNIIKLCDLREYVLKFMSQESMDRFLQFTRKHKFENQVYFTMFFLQLIYADGYETNIMNHLNLQDDSFINNFGHNTINNQLSFQKSVVERLFSCGNLDELIYD